MNTFKIIQADRPRPKEVKRNPEHEEFAKWLYSTPLEVCPTRYAIEYRGKLNPDTIHTVAGRLGFNIQVQKQSDGALWIWRRS